MSSYLIGTYPDGDGLAALERIRHSAPATRVLMLTSSNDREVLRAALAAGCDGYVTKSRGITEVLGSHCRDHPRRNAGIKQT